MKAEPPPLQIGTPCPKNWDDMAGDAKRRFCEHCQLHVHNLSGMKPGERAQFVAESRGRACITYELRPDGTMVTPSRWNWVLRPLRAFAALIAAMLPFAFSSCAPSCTRRTAGVPMPPPDASHRMETPPGNRTHGIVAMPDATVHPAPRKLGKMAIMGEAMPPKSPAKSE
ncbi:MAG: hypothetical protein ABIP20_14285 [Chthoniobacteraceae bacterium]